MRTRTPTPVVLLALAIAACGSPRDTTAVRDTAALGTASRVDKQAEEQKIRSLEQRWRQALAAKDSAAVGAFYAEDGFYLPQGSNGYGGFGDKEESLSWLEKATEERTCWLVWVGVDPMFDTLRDEPRFHAIVSRMGMERLLLQQAKG
jgi:hypothetical protein